jgi:hypothetical protein
MILMSRPLRIRFPAAVYHVMNRGVAGQPILLFQIDGVLTIHVEKKKGRLAHCALFLKLSNIGQQLTCIRRIVRITRYLQPKFSSSTGGIAFDVS